MLLGKVFLFFAIVPHGLLRHEFALPNDAVITVGHPYRNKDSTDESKDCYGYHLRAVNVRWRFQTYRRVTGTEVHDSYSFVGCGIQGAVKIGDQLFEWRSEPFNTMETTYPDGKWKLLGGRYSDDLSGSR